MSALRSTTRIFMRATPIPSASANSAEPTFTTTWRILLPSWARAPRSILPRCFTPMRRHGRPTLRSRLTRKVPARTTGITETTITTIMVQSLPALTRHRRTPERARSRLLPRQPIQRLRPRRGRRRDANLLLKPAELSFFACWEPLQPWRRAHVGVRPDVAGNKNISKESKRRLHEIMQAPAETPYV